MRDLYPNSLRDGLALTWADSIPQDHLADVRTDVGHPQTDIFAGSSTRFVQLGRQSS